ncbi:hypothetical protein C8Q73DRAFT_540100 [Cubamyces lactineus]|nr:hypothetical protein C8Q73DRAFT_540100 [Cubamyces lactineus]
MSSQGPAFVDIVRLTLLGNQLELAMICMLCYDHIITLGQEVRCIWMRKKTGAAVLYLLIRYVCLVSYCILPAITYILALPAELHVGWQDASHNRTDRIRTPWRLLRNACFGIEQHEQEARRTRVHLGMRPFCCQHMALRRGRRACCHTACDRMHKCIQRDG